MTLVPPVPGPAAVPAPAGLPVPPPRPPDTEPGQEQEQPSASAPAPEPAGPAPAAPPGPRLRHVRIDPPAGARGETDDPPPRVPGTPPRFGVVAVPQRSRSTSDRRSGTPSVRPVRLADITAAPVGLPGAVERPASVTPVPLPVPHPDTPAAPDAPDTPAAPVGTAGPAAPAGPATPADPPPTESRTEEPQS
ncbi:hypothetical protein ABZT27_18900 [Streptomyces sp. NPDC005389]|uniref:hypothetical protein n=1 Tax=Streptomyces sp. NPDC005389 TaxID=3157040 RepID=UPI0033AF23C5